VDKSFEDMGNAENKFVFCALAQPPGMIHGPDYFMCQNESVHINPLRQRALRSRYIQKRLLEILSKSSNRILSKIRVIVENILGDIKVFRIMSDRYRNKQLRFNEKFRIIAGIVNMKNGFSWIPHIS
jgi:hypothetical protein